MKLSANTRLEFIRTLPHFGMYFESIWIGVILSSTTVSDGNNKVHADKIATQNETQCQTVWMDFVCALAHFDTRFKSVRVGTKLWYTTDSDMQQKLHVYGNRGTKWNRVPNTPRGFRVHPASFQHVFWLCPSWCETFLHVTKCQHPEWTSYTPKHILACLSNPSESVWNFRPQQVLTGTINPMQTKLWHEKKLNGKQAKQLHVCPSTFRQAF